MATCFKKAESCVRVCVHTYACACVPLKALSEMHVVLNQLKSASLLFAADCGFVAVVP